MNIGPIAIASPFCQAGLAGYSDRAMRLTARRRGCGYAVTEALLDIIMLSGGQGLKKSIDINDEDHPVAGQIMGSEAHTMAPAARIMHDRKYDVVDLNFACPVKKIKNKARGGHMLLDIDRGISILQAVRDELPDAILTVSTRRGFDDSTESEDRFFKIIESAWGLGYAAIRVHARSVMQKYVGRAKWDFLTALKKKYPDKTIIGSGDVFNAEDAVRMKMETGVDIVWIARGAIGNPWIFKQADTLLKAVQSGLSLPDASKLIFPPTIHEQRAALAEHFSIAIEIHGEPLASRRMRKMGIKYSRFHPNAIEVKTEFIKVQSLREWNAVLDKWYNNDGGGVWPAAMAADEVNDAAMVSCETSDE